MMQMSQREAVDMVKVILEEKFPEFRMNPKPAQRGFHVVDPSNHENMPFLGYFKGKTKMDCIGGGIIVSAMGFGNLGYEIMQAIDAANKYALALVEEGFDPEVFSFDQKEPLIDRGAYVFVPLLK